MRRKIHGVLGIIESVNVQINFDPIFVLAPIRARAHARTSRIAAYRADFIFALPKRTCCALPYSITIRSMSFNSITCEACYAIYYSLIAIHLKARVVELADTYVRGA